MSVDERIVELLSEWGARRAQGEETSLEQLCHESPDLIETLRVALRQRPSNTEGAQTLRPQPPDGDTVVSSRASTETSFEYGGPAPDDGEIGRLGPYRVLRLLGAGGMGAVFQAIDDTLGRQVALKVLRPSLAHDARAQARFLREARAAAALEHDHIVTIFQVGEDRGIPFLAMPLLGGMSLETRLSDEGCLPIAEVLRIGREISEGLDAAHRRKVIHRDIKPANIWLEGERGRVKILDFGLARATDEAHRLTQEGTILGTPAYMAPEQATSAKHVDARLDLFSLGSVLYRMATGRVPFSAEGAVQTLVALVELDPVPPREIRPEIPLALNDLILKLLAKSPDNRPPTARAVIEAIREIEAPGGGDGQIPLIRLDLPDEPRSRAQPARVRHKGWIIGGAIALVLFALVGFALSMLSGLLDDKGRLTIDTPLPYVLVVVKQSGQQVAVIDPERQTTISLWPGAYDLALEGEHQGFKLTSDRITLRRGDEQVVKVILRTETAVPEAEAVLPPEVAGSDVPGLISRPSAIAGRSRWQVETRRPRSVVRSLAWSPNRYRLACVAEHERVVRIYDTEHLELVGLLVGHTAPIVSVAWSPVGQQLATASQDGTVRFWSADGTPGPVLKGHEGSPLCLAWNPDGHWLAVGGTDRIVRIWGRDGTPGPALEGHGASINAVAWSPDGRRLIVGTSQGQVHLWDTDGTSGPVFEGNSHPVLSVSWSADGRLIAAAGHDGARIWTTDGGTGPELEDAPSGISYLAWSPKSPSLAAACPDGTVRLWNAEGQPGPIMAREPGTGTSTGTAAGPGGVGVGVLTLAWSHDGRRLASAGQDGAVRLWDADGTPGPVLAAPLSPFHSVAWSPDGRQLVSDFPLDHSLRIWDADHARGPILEGNEATVNAVAWSPDGRWIAAGDSDNTVRSWSADGTPGRVIREGAGNITSIAWSPDSRRIAAGCFNNTVHLFRAEPADAPGVVLTGHTAHVLCVAWSPDGRRVASGGYDCTIRLWDVDERSSTLLGKLGQRVAALAWSPDGTHLASASHDSLVRIWTDSATPPLVLKGHTSPALAVGWSPDSRRLASGGANGTVRLWSADGTPGPVLDTQGGPVNSLAWGPDGRRLATANDDGTLRLWNVDGLSMERVIVPTSPLAVAVLDRNGQVVHASHGAEKDLVAFQLSPRGIVTLMTLSEFQKANARGKDENPRPKSKSRGTAMPEPGD